MSESQLATHVADWLVNKLTPVGISPWSILLELRDIGLEIDDAEGAVACSALGRREQVATHTWEAVFKKLVEKGEPFILISPDRDEELVVLRPSKGDPDDDDYEPGVQFHRVQSIENIPLMIRAFSSIFKDFQDVEGPFIYHWEVASTLARLIIGSRGEPSFLPENIYLKAVGRLKDYGA